MDSDWKLFEHVFKMSRSNVTEVPNDFFDDDSRVYVNKEDVDTWNAMRYNMIRPDITFYRLRAPKKRQMDEDKNTLQNRWTCDKLT